MRTVCYYRSELTEEEHPQSHTHTASKLEEEEEEMEGDDEDEEGSLTEKSQDETASPATMVQGTYDEDEEPTPLPMSYEHTRRSVYLEKIQKSHSHLNEHSFFKDVKMVGMINFGLFDPFYCNMMLL